LEITQHRSGAFGTPVAVGFLSRTGVAGMCQARKGRAPHLRVSHSAVVTLAMHVTIVADYRLEEQFYGA
jgi:hypothetical protein